MALCFLCGKISDHSPRCSAAPPGAGDATPAAKNDRALAALKEAQDGVATARTLLATPREAGKALFSVQLILEKSPSSDLTSFEHKRQYKAVEDSITKLRGEIEGALGAKETDQLLQDLAYTRKALELVHAVALKRKEMAGLKLDTLAALPELAFDPAAAADATDPGSVPRAACEAVEKRLASTQSIDAEVDVWGKSYLEPLAASEAPREWPSSVARATLVPTLLLGSAAFLLVAGGVVTTVLKQTTVGEAIGGAGVLDLVVGGVLFARAQAAKASLPGKFQALSQRFRERLYLVCVLRSVRSLLSALSKAEETLRAHTGGSENAARWKRIKLQEKDIIKSLAGESWEEARNVDDEMTRKIQAAGGIAAESIRPSSALTRDDWDGLAKAYQVERREDAAPTDDARLEALATVVLSHASSQPEGSAVRKRAISDARAAYGGRATGTFRAANIGPGL
jgi:hypothetical protein